MEYAYEFEEKEPMPISINLLKKVSIEWKIFAIRQFAETVTKFEVNAEKQKKINLEPSILRNKYWKKKYKVKETK